MPGEAGTAVEDATDPAHAAGDGATAVSNGSGSSEAQGPSGAGSGAAHLPSGGDVGSEAHAAGPHPQEVGTQPHSIFLMIHLEL